ncbi:MAG: tyrosine-type recombinase/integrase, partial [Candidatus Zixiibacteriota bacterium]
ALGINTALRGTDLLTLRVRDVLDERGEVRDRLYIRQSKTGKEQEIKLNRSAREAIDLYLAEWDREGVISYGMNSYLFPGRDPNSHLTPRQLTSLVNQWAEMVGLTQGSYGIGTLRKTWGYQARKRGRAILPPAFTLIQAKLGHASPSVTRRYIGITQDEISDVEERVEL